MKAYAFVATTGQPLSGIGYGPMSERLFNARVAAYEAQFGDEGKGAVAKSAFYELIDIAEGTPVEHADDEDGSVAAPSAPAEVAAPIDLSTPGAGTPETPVSA